MARLRQAGTGGDEKLQHSAEERPPGLRGDAETEIHRPALKPDRG